MTGLRSVEIDSLSNVFARLPGQAGENHPPVVVTAHLDTVFPAGTTLDIERTNDRISGPGIGDNSLAVAGLIWLAEALQSSEEKQPGDLWLTANVCEEGLGNLRGMQAVVDRFSDAPAAYIVLEGTALGQVYHRGLPVRRYRVQVGTEGGHSWAHFGRPSAIHELAHFIEGVGRFDIPENPRTTYNAGVIRGGTSVNTIAASAEIELDLRSESASELDQLAERVERLARKRSRDGVTFDLEIIGDRPGGALAADHPLVNLAARNLESLGMTPQLKIGSTDANVPLSRGLPAVCIGFSTGGGAHTLREFIDTGPLEIGMQHVMEVIKGVWEFL